MHVYFRSSLFFIFAFFMLLSTSCKLGSATISGRVVDNSGGNNSNPPDNNTPPPPPPTPPAPPAGFDYVCAGTPTTFTTGMNANVVVGQADFLSAAANAGSTPTAATLNTPDGVFADQSRLLIGDKNNNRVLIFDTIPSMDGASANLVLGQPDFVSNTANNGGLGPSSLKNPRRAVYDGTYFAVADNNNARVLIWNGLPSTNAEAADTVLGQPDFVTNTANNGGVSATSQHSGYPTLFAIPGEALVFADVWNYRVLFYEHPLTDQQAANRVVCQNNFTSASWGATASTCDEPAGVWTDGTRLLIADRYNHRVLVYNSFPTTDGAAADFVIDQPDLTSHSSNQGGSVAANTLSQPHGVASDGTRIFIADSNNHRVLIYNQFPTADNANADTVIGQANFISNSINQGGGAGAQTLRKPTDVYFDGCHLFVADQQNHRVMIY
ncbi:MAG: hypothetical protein H6626_04400 [Pseudobdellovibrionaceae bacterium]|nr:MAG: hypothetical protein H6626_04400 [Pseudobdellovibrionaceae bacterium]